MFVDLKTTPHPLFRGRAEWSLLELTGSDLGPLAPGAVEGEEQPAVADLHLQFLWAGVELHREQKPVWVPGPELEANGEVPRGRGV